MKAHEVIYAPNRLSPNMWMYMGRLNIIYIFKTMETVFCCCCVERLFSGEINPFHSRSFCYVSFYSLLHIIICFSVSTTIRLHHPTIPNYMKLLSLPQRKNHILLDFPFFLWICTVTLPLILHVHFRHSNTKKNGTQEIK